MKHLFFLILALITACTPLATKPDLPENGTVRLWREETLPVSDWTYVDTLRLSVRGAMWNSNLTPVDALSTTLFTRQTPDGPALLLVTRVVKTTNTEIFRYLGGSKTEFNGQTYRESVYALAATSTDPEYRRYVSVLHEAGVQTAPCYRVRVLDRLPTDSSLVRVMELTPGEGGTELPTYGRLYPQEKREPVPGHFF